MSECMAAIAVPGSGKIARAATRMATVCRCTALDQLVIGRNLPDTACLEPGSPDMGNRYAIQIVL